MLPELFRTRDAFRAAFSDGLADMLADEGLGSFILVLANAGSEPAIWDQLHQRLAARFAELAGRHRAGDLADTAPDDLAVFEQLLAVGFDRLQLACHRSVGPWQLQFNHLRSFRPPRMSDARVASLHKPFDPAGFHFNKPFLQREVLWQGELLGRHTRWLYNKFPFAPLHTLLVMVPDEQRPQWLREADHRAVWELAEMLGEGLPGLGFGYNAYGAYSSVNHQHLQGFVRDGDLYPVELACWRHNGGDRPYPVACERHQDAASAWSAIAALHAANIPYNLLYRPGTCYVLPRAFQGSYRHADWSAGFACQYRPGGPWPRPTPSAAWRRSGFSSASPPSERGRAVQRRRRPAGPCWRPRVPSLTLAARG